MHAIQKTHNDIELLLNDYNNQNHDKLNKIYNDLINNNIANEKNINDILSTLCSKKYCEYVKRCDINFTDVIDKVYKNKIKIYNYTICLLCDNILSHDDVVKISKTVFFNIGGDDIDYIKNIDNILIFAEFGHLNNNLSDILYKLLHTNRDLLIDIFEILFNNRFDFIPIYIKMKNSRGGYKNIDNKQLEKLLLTYCRNDLNTYLLDLSKSYPPNIEQVYSLIQHSVTMKKIVFDNILNHISKLKNDKLIDMHGNMYYKNTHASTNINALFDTMINIIGKKLSFDDIVKIIDNNIIINLPVDIMIKYKNKLFDKYVDTKMLMCYGLVKTYAELLDLCKKYSFNNITRTWYTDVATGPFCKCHDFIEYLKIFDIHKIDVDCLNILLNRLSSPEYEDLYDFLIDECGIIPTIETILICTTKHYYNDKIVDAFVKQNKNSLSNDFLIAMKNCSANKTNKCIKREHNDDIHIELIRNDDKKKILHQNITLKISVSDLDKFEVNNGLKKMFKMEKKYATFSELRRKIMIYISNNLSVEKGTIQLDSNIKKMLPIKITEINYEEIDKLLYLLIK